MKIYGAPLSPFVRKIIVYCVERRIDFELVPIFPMGPDGQNPEFVAASPMGKIPAINDDGFMLADSSAIVHYLEAKHGSALLPEDAKDRGRAVYFDEIADTLVTAAAGAVFFNRVVAPVFMGREGDLKAADDAAANILPPLLTKLEHQMPDSGFLVGANLTVADIALASVFVNARHGSFTVDPAQYPKLSAWLESIWARPSFAAQIAAEEQAIARASEK